MVKPSTLVNSPSLSYPNATLFAPFTLSVATLKSLLYVRLTLPATLPDHVVDVGRLPSYPYIKLCPSLVVASVSCPVVGLYVLVTVTFPFTDGYVVVLSLPALSYVRLLVVPSGR